MKLRIWFLRNYNMAVYFTQAKTAKKPEAPSKPISSFFTPNPAKVTPSKPVERIQYVSPYIIRLLQWHIRPPESPLRFLCPLKYFSCIGWRVVFLPL